jgi:putative sterol carrier protein
MSLDTIAEGMRPALAGQAFPGSLKFDCGKQGVIVLADGTATTEDRDTDCTIGISVANLQKLLAGNLNPMLAMATGKLKLSGNPAVAMGLAKLLG